ncbi:MAG: nucleotidyltransferase domain-containing protein [Nitrospirae bacterium]|nr:nucleotidyltransferase domain-containing protein [Nitrospirota bacterium]
MKQVLNTLRAEGKILLAYLYGSYAEGTQHKRSDIDLAVYINADSEEETIKLIDTILMSMDTPIEILRLDDEDESPFIVQTALKGTPLIEPDIKTFYEVSHRALHETEGIRFKREYAGL